MCNIMTRTANSLRILAAISFCIWVVVSSVASSSRCGNFTRQPLDQWIPEGDNDATFLCRHPEAVNGVGWLINGTGTNKLDPLPMGISTDVIILANGSQVATMTIRALGEYNGTVIGCLAILSDLESCRANGTLWVIAPPGPINNLQLHPTPTELTLTWEDPLNIVNYTIRFCVDVYRVEDDMKMLVRSECGVGWSNYTFGGIEESDLEPSNLFEFEVTPVYDVTGAKSGSSRNTSGYFTGAPSDLALNSVSVGVMISQDLLVTLDITFHDAGSLIVGGRKVDEFFVQVSLSSKYRSQSYTCSSGDPVVTANSTLSLYPRCDNLPIERDGSITVTATNGVGSSNLNKPLSTHFIQNIGIVPCRTDRCQVEVIYDLVADAAVAVGSLIMLHRGEDDIHYFVGQHLGSVMRGSVLVNGLARDHYSLLAFSLNKSGLLFRFPVNPQREAINVSVTTDSGDDRARTVHLKEFKHSGGGCFSCQFWPNSNASHCAVIVHTLREILVGSLFERSGDSAGGCVVVEPDGQHVVAFGYVNGTLCGHPYRIFLQDPKEEKGIIVPVAVMILVVVLVVGGALVPFVCIGMHCYLKNARRDRDTEEAQTASGGEMKLHEQLKEVTPMGEPLCARDVSPDWSTIRDEEEYKRYILPKLQEEEHDSGRFTLTTSTGSKYACGDDHGTGDVPAEESEREMFRDPHSEHGRSGVSLVVTHNIPDSDLTASEHERAMHRQATDGVDDSTDYNENLQQQNLSTNSPEDLHHSTYENDKAPAMREDENKQSDVIPFISQYPT